MRKMILGVASVLAVVLVAASAQAQEMIPPVQVGSVVIVGREAQEMIDELAHHRRHHYHRGGASLDWLSPSSVQGTPAPGLPPVYVNGVFITGHEAEEMIDKLSHMRHNGHWRAGMSLDWLGIGMAPAPIVLQQPVVMAPPPPVVMMPAPIVMAPAPVMVMPAPVPAAPVVPPAPEPNLRRFTLSLRGEAFTDHGSASVGLSFEGKRVGFNLNAGATLHRAESAVVDCERVNFKLVDAHLTFSPLSTERARLRLEVGALGAFTDDTLVVGPDFGLSGDVRILGPFGLIASVHGTGWPYKYVDAFGGIFAKLWILRVDAGWRYMQIEAESAGTRVKDGWNGPYLGAALVL